VQKMIEVECREETEDDWENKGQGTCPPGPFTSGYASGNPPRLRVALFAGEASTLVRCYQTRNLMHMGSIVHSLEYKQEGPNRMAGDGHSPDLNPWQG
jgi:hypothetical protein